MKVWSYSQKGLIEVKKYDKFVPNKYIVNHKSANCRPEGVNKYFQVETSKQAMLGPFNEQPFQKLCISPPSWLVINLMGGGGGGGGGSG